jgi:hypothetical protein
MNEMIIETISEFEMLQRIRLPDWLLTHEEYLLIEIPPIKNFQIVNKERVGNGRRDTVALFGEMNLLNN